MGDKTTEEAAHIRELLDKLHYLNHSKQQQFDQLWLLEDEMNRLFNELLKLLR